MRKIKWLVLTVAVLMMFGSFRCLAFNHREQCMEMEIPKGFEKIDNQGDYAIDIYIDAEKGQQISVLSKFNFDDISYSNLSDAEIWQIERDADSIFIPEGSNNYFLSEPEATRAYADSVDGGQTDGVRIRASYFDTSTNMETYSTVYLFSVESYYYAIAFVSYDNSEYWYKGCLDSLLIGDVFAKYTTSSNNNYSSDYSQETTTESNSDFYFADILEGVGSLLGIGLIIYLVYRLLFKKR
ncbi:MAG: hypothetical protein E7544_08710 [Ruminococcaceae bacterium]|nr:hypothetical protein [Oscillospiraceae bacterium]